MPTIRSCWGNIHIVDGDEGNVEGADPHRDRGPVDWVVGPGAPHNRQFGQLLEGIRKHNGLSRADAAAELGLSAEYLRLIETGQRTPALGQMRVFLRAYRAEGAVEQELPDGTRPDLVLLDPVGGEANIVEFKSRIRRARRGGRQDRDLHAESQGDTEERWDDAGPSEGRAAELGAVVLLLTRADSNTLQRIRQLLEDEVG